MGTSLTGKALDFGSKEYGFESHVSKNMPYNKYAFLINHINLLTASRQRWAIIRYNKKILPLLNIFYKIGLINSFIFVNKSKTLVKISPFIYKKTTFFKGVRLISTSSKVFTLKFNALKILNISLGETVLILETSKGLLTHKEALRLRIGGRILCILN